MTTPGWKGKITIKPVSSGSHTEIAKTVSCNPNLPAGENDASVFGDEGERRTLGRFDATFDTQIYFDFGETTHTDILDAVRDEDELEVRVHPDRDESGKYFQATCKVFDLSLDLSGGSNNTADFQLRNSDGNKWSYSNT